MKILTNCCKDIYSNAVFTWPSMLLSGARTVRSMGLVSLVQAELISARCTLKLQGDIGWTSSREYGEVRVCNSKALRNKTNGSTRVRLPCVVFTHSFIYLHSHIHSFLYSFILSFTHSFILSFTHSFIYSFIQSLIHSVNHAFLYSFILSFTHSLINSFSPLTPHRFCHY